MRIVREAKEFNELFEAATSKVIFNIEDKEKRISNITKLIATIKSKKLSQDIKSAMKTGIKKDNG